MTLLEEIEAAAISWQVSERRKEQFANALDGLVRDFLRIGMDVKQIAAMLEWKAEYLKGASLKAQGGGK